MKHLYSRLTLITSVALVLGYLIVSAAWVTMTPTATSGTQFTADIWNNMVGNMNDLNTRVSSLGSSLWATGATNSINYTAGNVGIGTTAPNKLLHLKTPTGANAELDIQSGTKPYWGIYHDETTEQLRFWNGADRIVFASGGNVGIGTASPSTKLEVNDNTLNSFAGKFIQTNSTNSNGAYVQTQTANAGDMGLGVFSSGGTIPVLITRNNGNVGIGTTTPGAKLDVYSTDGLYARIGHSNTSGTFPKVSILTLGSDAVSRGYTNNGGTLTAIGSAQIAAIQSASSNAPTDLAFSTTIGGGVLERMRITSGGMVGIGTTTGLGTVVRLAIKYDGGGTMYGMEFQPVTDGTVPISFRNAAGTVVGTISQTSTSVYYNNYSDRRLKKDFEPVSDALGKVNRITVSKFRFKTQGEDEPKTTGFIAQQLKPIAPYAVTGDENQKDKNGKTVYMSVDYGKLTPLLTAAVQELSRKIDSFLERLDNLFAKYADQQKEIDVLQRENRNIKSLICLDHPSAEVCK
ncbi:MAG: tail fiber domain-containing protein [Candidatus Gracilibacteria bacterium]|nr:tail fiber domain-containing protein [Candidatus Gracilibacteria bacterium]